MVSLKENIVITTYVSPHLFWVIESGNEKRSRTIASIKKELKHILEKADYEDFFEIGQLVAVEFNQQLYRGLIENIHCDGFYDENSKKNSPTFLCWLIDYGTMVESSKVYSLPLDLREIPALSLQVCLNNIAFVNQRLIYGTDGQPIRKKEYVITPTPRARNISNEILSGFKNIQLQYEYIEGDIYFGDILCKTGENIKSLKDELIKAEIIEENEEFFKKLQESINYYREKHSRIIYSICKDNTSILEEVKLKDISICLKQISLKKMQEYGLDMQTVEQSEQQIDNLPMLGYRNKNKSKNSEDTHSSDDLNSSIESDNNVYAKKTRRELMIKLLQEKKKIAALANEKDDNSEVTTNNSKQEEETKKHEISTESNGDLETTSSDFEPEIKSPFYRPRDNGVKKRTNFPPNCQIMPAGACHSFSNSKRTKKENEAEENFFKKDISRNTNKTSTPKQNKNTYSSRKSTLSKEKDTYSSEESTPSKEKSTYSSEESSPSREMNTISSEESASKTSHSFNNTTHGHPERQQLAVKPHCSCSTCNFWTENKTWDIETEFEPENECKIIACYEHSLFKKNYGANSYNIISLDYNANKKLGERSKPKLLVHSSTIPTPTLSIAKVNFDPTVLKCLMYLGYRIAKKIQAYTWQSLLRNQNVFMVHGPKTGKTLAYLPVMCTFMMQKEDRYHNLVKSGGPIVVILCSHSRKCEDIYYLTKRMLPSKSTKVVFVTNPNISASLHNTDMLITTPTILVELLKSNKINLKRLCHFILEDGSKIINKDLELMDKIFKLIDNMLEKRKFSKSVQLVVCAEHWNKRLEKLLNTLDMLPLVCIGNYLEAAIYGGITFSIQIIDSSYKGKELIGLLKNNYRIFKTILFCNQSEIKEIQELLLLKGIDATVVNEDLSEEAVRYLEEAWDSSKEGQYTVMVCTDVTFNTMMTISSANILVHYSLPNSWTKFIKRFGSLLESCKSPVDEKKVKGIYRSTIFCDEYSKEQAYKFLSYLNETDMKYQLSQFNLPEILKKFENEKVNNRIDFCDFAKLFGYCSESSCPKRHILNKQLDSSELLPKSGKIRFKIVEMVNLTHYFINLIQHFDDDNITTDYDIEDITKKLTDTLKIKKNAVNSPLISHYYAYKCDDTELFHRCRLLEQNEDNITVVLVDKGSIINSTKSKLYQLPNIFNTEHYPQKAIEMYLLNCIPPFRDEYFPQKSISIFKHELDKINYTNQVFEGVIGLQFAHTIWLSDVYEEKYLTNNSVIPGLQLIQAAVRMQLVQYNQNQFKKLQKLCADAGIFTPTQSPQRKIISKKIEQAIPQWAYLDVEKPNEVIFSSAVSPEEFFVRLSKYNDLLYKLQKEIQSEIRKPNYPILQNVATGDLCLAPVPNENDYYRAVIKKSEENKSLCFFVDFGDEGVVNVSDLKYIDNKFITKLPFQSIQCCLHGLTPVLSEWQNEATDILYEYSVEPQTDIFRNLYAKVTCKKESPIMKQKAYSVILKDGYGDRNVVINQLLIDCGLASSNSEICDFEIPDLKDNADEDELDYKDEILDICRKTDEIDENFNVTNEFGEDMDLTEMDFFAEDPTSFFKELISYSRPEPERPAIQELPRMEAVEPVDYNTPQVFWYQTKSAVRISVKLTNTTDCNISLTKNRILNFRATKNEQPYVLKLILYEPASSLQYTLSGLDIRITLTKSKSTEWPRLIISKQPARNIHYDLTMLKVEEHHKKFLEIPKDVDSDSELSDGERDMMYNVYSDLDSEFDADLKEDSD